MELVHAVESMCNNYGSYVMLNDLLKKVNKENKNIRLDDVRKIVRANADLHLDRDRVYLERVWQQEEFVANWLNKLRQRPPFPPVKLPETLQIRGITLTKEQRDAVALCLNSRLSLLLGKPGSGKTTIAEAIIGYSGAKSLRLCSPTAKAAINLGDRTGCNASTLHRALHIFHVNDFLNDQLILKDVELLIVDEGSMITIDMLGGLLRSVEDSCRIVIIGDENQLPAVGPGDVIQDLLTLKIPCARLRTNHRQNPNAKALRRNVEEFKHIRSERNFARDASFRLFHSSDKEELMDRLVTEAAKRYSMNADVRVLTYCRRDVGNLNERIQRIVNPYFPGKQTIQRKEDKNGPAFTFVNNDRVVFIRNNNAKRYYNGEAGILHIGDDQSYYVELRNGRKIDFPPNCDAYMLLPAYATTIHRAQGGQFDSVLMYVPQMSSILNNRNTIYTGISRAKQELLLYSDDRAVSFGLQYSAPKRTSSLVEKTLALFCAA
jgi:exodeoxyribonuclease V alpha subunit